MNRTPCVLIVDDNTEGPTRELARELFSGHGVSAEAILPSELFDARIADADLVLVDYKLDTWPTRDGQSELGLKPPDGLSLATIIQRHARRGKAPTGVAILTGEYEDLMQPLPVETRPHVVARLNGLEWIFNRSVSNLALRVSSLARAVTQLPKSWSTLGRKEVVGLLDLSQFEEALRNDLLRDVARCRPSVHAMSQWSHGLAFVRWLAHRVLPYPCCLLRDVDIAARFCIDPKFVRGQLADEESPLKECFRPYQYTGILHDFDGPRWWSIGIEEVLWDITEGASFDFNMVRDALADETGLLIPPSDPDSDAVVVYDRTITPMRDLCSSDDAVRIMPDDWPSYADQPWAAKEDAREYEELRAIVIAEDEELLDE